ncbi:putative receptor-like protein kinase [Apostasia shenzhenica]|uniref:Putative receptor-like protein kinase n=1 Tax=Apostasia shenzhenica TaxID=1088818 RepID=A0A2I0B1Q4_9ASPA|nr:putative receptor-like protein kinase [Apostasia shenzhenica]
MIAGLGSGSKERCSSTCGRLNISYPLRLTGDPPTCGDPDHELICDGDNAIFEIKSRRFSVTNISYESGILNVVDMSFARGMCSLPDQFISPREVGGNSSFFFAWLLYAKSWISFMNCTEEKRDEKYWSIPCLSHENNTFMYATFGTEASIIRPSCRYVAMVPASANDGPLLLLVVIAIIVKYVLSPLVVLSFLAHKYWKIRRPINVVEKFLRNQQTLSTKRYAYTDIIAITSHFHEKLGQGGFGSVFKGELPGRRMVAVKMLNDSRHNGEEFINEVSTIGSIHHVNVVKLIGFCAEGSRRALVYDYMPNGSLDKYIFSLDGIVRRPFSWAKLNDIALGIARGIDYLHRGCEMRILHFDIKPHNVLLDQNFNPKISDFGLARLYPKGNSMITISAARGTIGYIAPELISRSFGVVSYKSDVYSFGMLLMEMAAGRRNVNPRVENSSQIYYPSWIYDQLKQQEGLEISHALNIGETEKKLYMVGLWCIQMRPSDRPSMSKVVEMLEGDTNTLQMPLKPFFSTSRSALIKRSVSGTFEDELSAIYEHQTCSRT